MRDGKPGLNPKTRLWSFLHTNGNRMHTAQECSTYMVGYRIWLIKLDLKWTQEKEKELKETLLNVSIFTVIWSRIAKLYTNA